MLFLDSAIVEEARRAASLPFVGGLSCNPTLMARSLGVSKVSRLQFEEHLRALASVVTGSLFVQTLAPDPDGIVRDGLEIVEILGAERSVVKVPYTPAGLAATRRLADEGVAVCLTAVFTPLQAFVAATSGATWIAPYCNRITASGGDGVLAVRQMLQVHRAHGLDCRLLVASVKSVAEMEAVLLEGAHHVTVPLPLLEEALEHPLTDQATVRFVHDLSWA